MVVLSSCSGGGGAGTDVAVEDDLGNQCSPYAECCNDSDCVGFGDQCAKQACVGGKCESQPAAFGTACDDENQCTIDDKCDGIGKCAGKLAKGMECDDGDSCTADDECSTLGQCEGTGVDCDDGDQCTTDTCLPEKGCLHESVPEGSLCDDGSLCTSSDKCESGKCSGVPKECDVSDCVVESCEPQTGECTEAAMDLRKGEWMAAGWKDSVVLFALCLLFPLRGGR